jgi:hypothetical protein
MCLSCRKERWRALSYRRANSKWQQLWDRALGRAAGQRAKTQQNPVVERQRTSKEEDPYARKCATAGNLSKACKIVCKEQIAACNDDTIQQLRDLHPEQPLDLDLEQLSLPVELE